MWIPFLYSICGPHPTIFPKITLQMRHSKLFYSNTIWRCPEHLFFQNLDLKEFIRDFAMKIVSFWIQNSYQFENAKQCFIVEKPLRKWELLKKLTIRKLKTWFYRRKTYYFAFCAANRLSSSSFVSSILRDSPPLVNSFQMQYPFKAHGNLSSDVLW